MKISTFIVATVLATLAGCTSVQQSDASGAAASKQWFSAWATSHNARATAPSMSGKTVRMVLVPDLELFDSSR